MFEKTNLVSKIFYANIIVFILTMIIPGLFENFMIYPLNSNEFSLYQFITSMFTHGGIFHLLFNMFALLSFGPFCENDLGEKKFMWLYIIAGIFGAFIQLLNVEVPLVGASAAIFGLLIYYTMKNPNQELSIIFLPFLSFKAKHIVSVFVIFEALMVISGTQDGIAHLAHLGGGFIGLCGFFMNKR
jgi:membrane associated rhomboid family serine protease